MFSLRSFFASIRSVILLWICLLSPSTGFIIKSPLFAAVRSCSRNPSSSSSSHQNNQLMMNAPARVPNKRDRKVESILEAVDFSRRPVPSSIPLMDDPLMGMIGSILNAADARKATYLSAFRISSVTGNLFISLFLTLFSSLTISLLSMLSLTHHLLILPRQQSITSVDLVTEITTFMVVIEGNSRPQNQAIALAVEDAVLLEYQQQTIKQGQMRTPTNHARTYLTV